LLIEILLGLTVLMLFFLVIGVWMVVHGLAEINARLIHVAEIRPQLASLQDCIGEAAMFAKVQALERRC